MVPWSHYAVIPWYHGTMVPRVCMSPCWCQADCRQKSHGITVPWDQGAMVPWCDGRGTMVAWCHCIMMATFCHCAMAPKHNLTIVPDIVPAPRCLRANTFSCNCARTFTYACVRVSAHDSPWWHPSGIVGSRCHVSILLWDHGSIWKPGTIVLSWGLSTIVS